MLRDRFLWADHDGAYTLPESVNRSFVADTLLNTFTFTANNTWEVFEPDCTTYVTTGRSVTGWLAGWLAGWVGRWLAGWAGASRSRRRRSLSTGDARWPPWRVLTTTRTLRTVRVVHVTYVRRSICSAAACRS